MKGFLEGWGSKLAAIGLFAPLAERFSLTRQELKNVQRKDLFIWRKEIEFRLQRKYYFSDTDIPLVLFGSPRPIINNSSAYSLFCFHLSIS